jgi:hypothetical protein
MKIRIEATSETSHMCVCVCVWNVFQTMNNVQPNYGQKNQLITDRLLCNIMEPG